MKGPRGIVGLIVLCVAAFALKAVFAPPPEAAPPRSFTSSTQCRECHTETYAEWESSWHSRSWVDPDVRALSNDFANTDCIDCHAPRPILETGIGKRVLPRSSRRKEGVDCIACHMLPDGRMAGTIDDPSAACRPVATVELQREEYCAVCHDQHLTVQQWAASNWPAAGKDCIECHMPFRDGDPNRGRGHLCMGGHDLALIQAAVALRGVREAERWVVEVENVGVGHSFPTDERSRAADVFWRPLSEAPGPWRHIHRFRSPYRHEVDVPETLLLAHEVRRIPIEDADADGAIEVALFYKLSPYFTNAETPDPDAEAQLVHKLELRP